VLLVVAVVVGAGALAVRTAAPSDGVALRESGSVLVGTHAPADSHPGPAGTGGVRRLAVGGARPRLDRHDRGDAPTPVRSTPRPSTPRLPPAPVATAHGILPPADPSSDLAPDPDFLTVCAGAAVDRSSSCQQAALAAIDNGRRHEGLGPMLLPGDWAILTPPQQLFVATNLERTARGLPPLWAMTDVLDQAAAGGAVGGTDPMPPAGAGVGTWGSNWAGAVGSPLEAVYLWMYDDGPGSSNVDCGPGGGSGCWGHRNNVLLHLACASCTMGVALDPQAWRGTPSWAELLADTAPGLSVSLSWSTVVRSGL
jgi:hypothetical protein